MTAGLWIAIALIALVGFVRWGRAPLVHRGVKRTEVGEFLANLLRNGRGSKIVVRGEISDHTVTIEKTHWDDSIQEFAVRFGQDVDVLAMSASLARLNDPGEPTHSARVLQDSEGKARVVVTISRRSSTAFLGPAVQIALEAIPSSPPESFSVHFETRRDLEQHRDRFERMLKEDGSARRVRLARRALVMMERDSERSRGGDDR